MSEPKRKYENAGTLKRYAQVEFMVYRDKLEQDLVSLQCAAMVLNVRLQAVVKLGLPRHLVEKRAAYRKGDIEALLAADRVTPNLVLRELQEVQRQAEVKQKVHPSRRYKSTAGHLLPKDARAARKATETNCGKPLTRDEAARDPWSVLRLKGSR